jgi:hypothetical protein
MGRSFESLEKYTYFPSIPRTSAHFPQIRARKTRIPKKIAAPDHPLHRFRTSGPCPGPDSLKRT